MKALLKKIIPESYRIKLRLDLYKITSIFYLGNTYYCNSCNKSFRKFKSYGQTNRPNVRCPYCNALERERLMKFYFTDYFQKNKPEDISILHFAPKRSTKKLFKSFPKINYFAADINPNLGDYEVDICNIGFEDEKFDIIICSHVLAHIQDQNKAVEELRRVLHPDGFLLILSYVDNNKATTETVDLNSPDVTNFFQNDTVYRYHGLDFANYLASFDFDVEEFDYKKTFDKSIIEKYCLGLDSRENFYICRKKVVPQSEN